MITPIESLTFSMHANPGVYALLVGSGLSRSAGIPTGWEITLDLVTRLASSRGKAVDKINPEQWYRETFEEEPDYSKLLDQLAKTPTERSQLLNPYWEPDNETADPDNKKPTSAHRAIAKLVAGGFVRVIVTTNFDRLIEMALVEFGITPKVISTEDDIEGAPPLIHTQCCVIKVNGDYRDTRIRNTAVELEEYPPPLNRLLDTIFDSFGLVVCGWSGVWDNALRVAIKRCPTRRYTTYWAARGNVAPEARELMEWREAQPITIEDADSFFDELAEGVQSLSEHTRPHPLSRRIITSRFKRYVANPYDHIRLADLVDGEVSQLLGRFASDGVFFVDNHSRDTEAGLIRRVQSYDRLCQTLVEIACIGGIYARVEHGDVWQRVIARFGDFNRNTVSRSQRTRHVLEPYPASLLFMATGIGAVKGEKYDLFWSLAGTTVRHFPEKRSAVEYLTPGSMFAPNGVQFLRFLPGMSQRRVPTSDWLQEILFQAVGHLFHSQDEFEYQFDQLEIMLALAYGFAKPEHSAFPIGAYGYRHENRKAILKFLKESRVVATSAFSEALAQIEPFESFVERTVKHWH